MKVRTIGKIQIILGALILIASVIFLVWGIKNVYYKTITDGADHITGTWGDVKNIIYSNATPDPASLAVGKNIMGEIISDLVILAASVKTTMYIFGANAVILIVLAIMLILQGLANMNRA